MSEEVRCFLTGPTYVRADVLAAMNQETIGHRSPEFRALYRSVVERLPAICGTSEEVLVVTSSGSFAWDMAVASALQGQAVLNLTNGAFSERFYTTCEAWGCRADRVTAPWGRPIDPDLVRDALGRKRYAAVTVAHNETSTGVLSPLEEIARVVREHSDALFLVDAVSSFAATEIEADAWGLDLVFTSSQKALALPPGLMLVTFSERFRERAEAVENRGYYTDLLRWYKKHLTGATLTTPAIPQIWALERQLDVIDEEGLEARFARHWELRRRCEELAAERGFTYASVPEGASPTVSCLKPPAGVAAPELTAGLKAKGFVAGSGYGVWKPETLRVGHMGEVRLSDLERLFAAIDEVLAEIPRNSPEPARA